MTSSRVSFFGSVITLNKRIRAVILEIHTAPLVYVANVYCPWKCIAKMKAKCIRDAKLGEIADRELKSSLSAKQSMQHKTQGRPGWKRQQKICVCNFFFSSDDAKKQYSINIQTFLWLLSRVFLDNATSIRHWNTPVSLRFCFGILSLFFRGALTCSLPDMCLSIYSFCSSGS